MTLVCLVLLFAGGYYQYNTHFVLDKMRCAALPTILSLFTRKGALLCLLGYTDTSEESHSFNLDYRLIECVVLGLGSWSLRRYPKANPNTHRVLYPSLLILLEESASSTTSTTAVVA
jgi:hypothetical protein